MIQEEWDKLLPAGMQWVSGREIALTDTIVADDGSHLTALEFVGCKNTWNTIRACCPIEPAIKNQPAETIHIDTMKHMNSIYERAIESRFDKQCEELAKLKESFENLKQQLTQFAELLVLTNQNLAKAEERLDKLMELTIGSEKDLDIDFIFLL